MSPNKLVWRICTVETSDDKHTDQLFVTRWFCLRYQDVSGTWLERLAQPIKHCLCHPLWRDLTFETSVSYIPLMTYFRFVMTHIVQSITSIFDLITYIFFLRMCLFNSFWWASWSLFGASQRSVGWRSRHNFGWNHLRHSQCQGSACQ